MVSILRYARVGGLAEFLLDERRRALELFPEHAGERWELRPQRRVRCRRGAPHDVRALEAFFTTPLHFAQDPHGAPPLFARLPLWGAPL